MGLTGLLGITAGMMIAGCSPSEEEMLSKSGYQQVGDLEESTVWVAQEPDDSGKYGIHVAGKLRGFCKGSVIAGIGEQICNMGEEARGSLYMVGAPAAAVAGTITLTNGKIVHAQTFALPGHPDMKLAIGTSASSHAKGFVDVEFATANGVLLDRSGNQKQ
ncbi:hypothetical protein [Pseudarthrobacter oxydans]